MKNCFKSFLSIFILSSILLLSACFDSAVDNFDSTSSSTKSLNINNMQPHILDADTVALLTGSQKSQNFTANVMAPLHVSDWNEFDRQLTKAKEMGVNAVSVDVWWGDVEKYGDQQFDWSYYDTIFSKIRAKGLKVLAIMSFHQCGGCVGDDYTSHLPSWIWTKYNGVSYKGITITSDDLKYHSEWGNKSEETIALWIDELVSEEYIEFMDEFENHFSAYVDSFQEINVSCGPAGELRYPSYNTHDNFSYPSRGSLQAYSRLAKADFRNYIQTKYRSLSAVNNAWGTNLTSFNQINPPGDHDVFFTSGAYKDIQYGKDFLEWYNGELVEHGKNMLSYAAEAFDDDFSSIVLGFKIPGIHWKMSAPSMPRAAEVCAGLLTTPFTADNGHGYNNIMNMINNVKSSQSREVILHFTCLEMNNKDYANEYSKAKDLVFHVAKAAENKGVTIKGENALNGGNDQQYFWDNIDNAITYGKYKGITILRINDVVYGNSYNYYKNLINKHSSGTIINDITIHYAEFEYASKYYVHAWEYNDQVKDFEMHYEGFFNGRHWWKTTISNADSNFMFCFKNSNNSWDGTNRHFDNGDIDVYLLPGNAYVYGDRP